MKLTVTATHGTESVSDTRSLTFEVTQSADPRGTSRGQPRLGAGSLKNATRHQAVSRAVAADVGIPSLVGRLGHA